MELSWILNVNLYHTLKTIVPRQLLFCKQMSSFHELGTIASESDTSGNHALI